MSKVTVKKHSVEDSPEKGIIIQNLTIRPVVRQSQDIEKWRNAIKSAEAIHPVRVPLYDLYDEIELDAVLTSLIEKRKLGVTKTKLRFVNKAGEDIPEITDLLKKKSFRELRKEIVAQKVYGHRVIELINDANGFRIFPIPLKHVKPKEGLIVYEQYGTDGLYYREPPNNKFILEVGKWNDFGLMMKAAQYVIYKRGGFGDWAHFAEIFGMPFREARYDGYNQEVRKQLEMALEQAGSASYAILPKDSEFTLHEARNTKEGGQLYNDLRKACNEELSILFLGQTETTSKTAGKLGGNDDTHEQTEDDINTSDKEDELSIFNEQVLPILANLGFPVDGGSFEHEVKEEKQKINDRVNNIIRLRKEAQLPIDDDHIYEITGIPKPTNYNQQKKELQEASKPEPGNDPANPNKPKKKKEKEAKKLSWKDQILLGLANFFDQAPKN